MQNFARVMLMSTAGLLIPLCSAWAHADTNLSSSDPSIPAEKREGASSDQTGTNPLNFQRTVALRNEYIGVGDNYRDTMTLAYAEPLLPNLKLTLELPLIGTDFAGDTDVGLGDASIKASHIPYANDQFGIALGLDLTAPTASQELLGADKWQLGPSVTFAFFMPNNVIFAPAYKHNVSFAGDDDRADIHSGVFDLYLVWRFDDSRQWMVLDPTWLLDYENDQYDAATVRMTYGRVLGTFGGAGVSGFIRGGVGMGNEKPYDWSAEFGISFIGL